MPHESDQSLMRDVHDFWNAASCGEELLLAGDSPFDYRQQSTRRFALEPYILGFAKFSEARGLRVLEIGVGLGADHQCFAEAGADLCGIDLTERAIEHTKRRLAAFGHSSRLAVADAENLPFGDGQFDVVYSWGCIHHSPNTQVAVDEIFRVLKPGGDARIMIYHRWSLVGLMLWVRYGLFRLRPFTGLDLIYARHLESPGTKAYSVGEARELFKHFGEVSIETVLTHGDLLESGAGQRHRGYLLSLARRFWPRRLLRALFPRAGLFMLINARKV